MGATKGRDGDSTTVAAEDSIVRAYTDGACLGNPGPGGYGAVLIYRGHRKELCGGVHLTTNNRMELMACIVALRSLKYPCAVEIISDSSYVVRAMSEGWVDKWRRNGWKRGRADPVKNVDLWQELLGLCAGHRVRFRWVRGHAGHPENERADELATAAAQDAFGRAGSPLETRKGGKRGV